jgi:serine/threonine protein kinase
MGRDVNTAPSRVETGVRIGPYLLEHRLANTSASSIYIARTKGGDRVVLRLLQAEAATKGVRSRLKREARALAGVEHPGVVRVLRAGDHQGLPWVATEYVRGIDFERLLSERGPLPYEVAFGHAIEVAEALDAAHAVGVLHRGLKPANVILAPDGHVVVVDFGIVPDVTAERATGEEAHPGHDRGVPSAYAAPEQIEHGLADERSDVWALGCFLYEMLAGEPPFGRDGASMIETILRDEPVFPSRVPVAAVHIVNACLRKNSFARIASARELIVLLRDTLEAPHSESAPSTERSSAWPCPSGPAPSEDPSRRPSTQSGRAGLGLDASSRGAFPSGTIPPPPRVPSMPFVAHSSRSSAIGPRPPASVTRTTTPRGRIKGAALRAGIAWFGEECGPAALARVLELASPELRGILRSKDPMLGLIASGWYDTQLVGELVELIERVASPGDRATFGSSVGEAIARDNVGGAHKALFRLVASPPLLEANAQRMWRTYVDEGTLTVRLRDAGSFEAKVRGWARHHPSVCRTIRAMLESSLRAVGYPGLALERTHCVALGDTQCAFDGTWQV